MKYTTLQITPISLALLGGLSLIPVSAQAANSVEIEKEGVLDKNTLVYNVISSDADVANYYSSVADKVALNLKQSLDLQQSLERANSLGASYKLKNVFNTYRTLDTSGITELVIPQDDIVKAGIDLTVNGDVRNDGILDLTQDGGFNTLTVNGDYYGNDGLVRLNVALGDDNSPGDKLQINGNVFGRSILDIHNKDGLGEATNQGIKVIDLADSSVVEEGENAFSLLNHVEAGAYEYNILAYNAEAGHKGFYLQSVVKPKSDERDSITIINGKATYKLLRKAVGPYVLNQQINSQALAELNANLLQRSGDKRTEVNYFYPNQTWVRVLGSKNDLTVHNLEAKTSTSGLQVGWDLGNTADDHLQSRMGAYVAYNSVESKLIDTYRSDTEITGRINTNLAALGFYQTLTLDSSYLDILGSVHFLHSDYEVAKGGQHNALGASLSLEVGTNLDLGHNLFIEPQAQLSYQSTHYASFKDAVEKVKSYSHQSFRPRLGLRLGYHDVKGTNLWFHANLETDLLKTTQLSIGQDLVAIDRGAKYLYDLGINGQVALSPTTILYGSTQYKGSFDKAKTLSTGEKVKATKLKGFGGELGLRFIW